MRAASRLSAAQWLVLLDRAAVPAAWRAGLATYLELLQQFGNALDLVASADAETLLREHVLESLAGAPLLGERGRLIDLGSGAGLPGIPLLIARPQWEGTLLEPRERRWAFLREAVRAVGVRCEVRRERVDQWDGRYDAIVIRALSATVWARHVERLLGEGGEVLWWTTTTAALGEGDLEPVVTSPLPDRRRGSVVVLRRRST